MWILPAPDYSGKNETIESQMRDAAFEYEGWWEQQRPDEAATQDEEFFNEFFEYFWFCWIANKKQGLHLNLVADRSSLWCEEARQ